jgi:thioredoxin 1
MTDTEPTRDEIDRLPGPVLLEFGASWCGYCRALAPALLRLLEDYPSVQHIKIEDGPGRPLGRSFRVKLWPTLVFLRDGTVLKQLARPEPDEVRAGLEALMVVAP